MAFRCMNCGGNMVYDVGRQQMHCQHCDSTCAPDDFEVFDRGIAEVGMARFTCRSCGAELEATDDSLIGLCPYCGGQSMVRGESGATAVERMIPFTVSKDQCPGLYQDFAAGVRYLPPEMKDPQHLTKFTGIYLPYWRYDVRLRDAHVDCHKVVRSTLSYDDIEYYRIDADIEGDYLWGAPIDASRYLDDEISDRILPYDTDEERPFHPAFLAGFYADASTVPADRYLKDAVIRASNDLVADAKEQLRETNSFVFDDGSSAKGEVLAHHSTLFPAWFLTWRRGDRVAYVAINGQTGKVVSDLPLDYRSFGIGCLIASVAAFALLEFLVQPTPLITSLISLVALLVMAYELRSGAKRIFERATHANDKGWTPEGPEGDKSGAGGDGKHFHAKEKKKWGTSKGASVGTVIVCLIIIFVGSIAYASSKANYMHATTVVVAFLAVYASAWVIFSVLKMKGGIETRAPLVSALILLVTSLINAAVVVISPVNDAWYYLGDLVCIVGLLVASLGMIATFNASTMRPLPKLFDREEVER